MEWLRAGWQPGWLRRLDLRKLVIMKALADHNEGARFPLLHPETWRSICTKYFPTLLGPGV